MNSWWNLQSWSPLLSRASASTPHFVFVHMPLVFRKHNSFQLGKQTKPETKFGVEALSLMTFSGILSSVHTGTYLSSLLLQNGW